MKSPTHSANVVSLDDRRAKRVAWDIFLAAVVAIGLITTAAAIHNAQRLQAFEEPVGVNAVTGEQR